MSVHSRTLRKTGRAAALLACLAAFAAAAPAHAHQPTSDQIAALTTEIRSNPRDASPLLRRGELYRVQGAWASAEADFEGARRIDPALAAVDLSLGRLYLNAGRADSAKASLDRYLERRPGNVAGLALRARALIGLGDPAGALLDWDSAIAAAGKNGTLRPQFYLARAEALLAADPTSLAAALEGVEARIGALHAPVTLQLKAIDLEVALGRIEEAISRIAGLESHAERKESWAARRARILEAAGRRDEALAAWRDAESALKRLSASRRSPPAMSVLDNEITVALGRLAAPSRADSASVAVDAPEGASRPPRAGGRKR